MIPEFQKCLSILSDLEQELFDKKNKFDVTAFGGFSNINLRRLESFETNIWSPFGHYVVNIMTV